MTKRWERKGASRCGLQGKHDGEVRTRRSDRQFVEQQTDPTLRGYNEILDRSLPKHVPIVWVIQNMLKYMIA